jgi:Flp pilus assembly pilin Flp
MYLHSVALLAARTSQDPAGVGRAEYGNIHALTASAVLLSLFAINTGISHRLSGKHLYVPIGSP